MKEYPNVLAVTGPLSQYEEVVTAVHNVVKAPPRAVPRPRPAAGLRLTPRPLCVPEDFRGCNNRCTFCIIPKAARRPPRAADYSSPRPRPEALRTGREGTAGHFTRTPPPHVKLSAWPYKNLSIRRNSFELCRELGDDGHVDAPATTSTPTRHVDEVFELMTRARSSPTSTSLQHRQPRRLKKNIAPPPRIRKRRSTGIKA